MYTMYVCFFCFVLFFFSNCIIYGFLLLPNYFQRAKDKDEMKDDYMRVAFAYHFIMEKIADLTPTINIDGELKAIFLAQLSQCTHL